MNWLLMPADERELLNFLVEELGLVLLAHDLTEHGDPVVSDPQTDGRLGELPRQPGPSGADWDFNLWAPMIGPVRLLGDAPEPTDPKDRVMLRLNKEMTPLWRELIDSERTPVVHFGRSRWHRNGSLCPGVLGGQARPTREQPKELLALLRKIKRWLKSKGERLNPFEHCHVEIPVKEPPRNLNMFWVWARPAALTWVRGGGSVWPWNA